MQLINVNVLPETNVDWIANGELGNETVLNRPIKAVATHVNTLINEVTVLTALMGNSFHVPLNDLGAGAVNTAIKDGVGVATFTRATTATTVNSAGTVISVASGTARSYYDPTTLVYLGYLSEGARTNLCLQSEVFNNASWIKTDITVTANSIAAPDGNTTADLLTEGVVGTALLSQGSMTITAGATVTKTLWAKRGNNDWQLFTVGTSGASSGFRAWFNLNTGAIGTTGVVGTGTFTSGAVKAYPNGWYRLRITGIIDATTTNAFSFFHSASADNSGTRVNNATYYLWGAQLEQATFASSYIPTTTAAVTRNADVLTYPSAGNVNFAQGTAYAELSTNYATSIGNPVAVACTITGSMLFLTGGASSVEQRSYDGTAFAGKAGLSNMNTAPRKRVSSWGAGGQRITGDGIAVSTASFDGTMGSGAILEIGNSGGANHWDGTIKNVRIWQTQLPDATLQALTA